MPQLRESFRRRDAETRSSGEVFIDLGNEPSIDVPMIRPGWRQRRKSAPACSFFMRFSCGGGHLAAGSRVNAGFGKRAGFVEALFAEDEALEFAG